MWIKSKVIMLAVDMKAQMPKDCLGKIFVSDDTHVMSVLTDLEDVIKANGWFQSKPQDLFICNTQPIETDDYYIDDCLKIRRALTDDSDYWQRRPDYVKIIASTDARLGLPCPSQDFLQKYRNEYNKGNAIINVMVEYDYEYIPLSSPSHPKTRNFPIVKFGNTIIIRKAKDTWSREEVLDLLTRCWQQSANKTNDCANEKGFSAWVEDNLN